MVVSFVPQSLHPRNTVAYVGDSLESVYIVGWNVHQFFRSPLHLFDANVLYPQPRALSFTDHRLLPSLLVAPVLWASGNPVLAYNVAVALAGLLAAFAARHLALRLGADAVAAWAAGALYAFHTYQLNEAPRLNIIFHGFLPLALGELVLFLKAGEARRAWTTAGYLLLQGFSSNYHLLYGAMLVGLIVSGAAVARPVLVVRRLPVLLLAAATAGLLFAPVAIPYLETARAQGYARGLPEGVDLAHYLSTSPTNLLYGAIGLDVRLQQRGPHFVGFVSLALAVAAVAAWVRRRRVEADGALLPAGVWVPGASALAILMVALSLGRDIVVFGQRLGPGPYRLLHRFVPGFQLVRIPERLGLVAMLFVALLAARSLTLLRASRFRALAPLLAVLVPLEHVSTLPTSTRVPVGRAVPAVYEWLAHNPVRAAVELPVRGEGLVREETLDMYFSTYHWRPLVQGYTAYPSLLTRHLRRLAAVFPEDVSLQAFQRIGVDTIVVHHGRPLGVDLSNQLRDRGGNQAPRFPELLRLAGLDLYGRLPAAVTAGRIRREARFDGTTARLFESTADEVYRLLPVAPVAGAPFPNGHRRRDAAWRYRTKVGDPAPAADGDLGTSWVVPRALHGDEFLEVTFPEAVRVSGLVLTLQRDSVFPTRFRVAGREPGRPWRELARFDDAHALQFLDRLLADSRSAAIGFDLGDRELTGLSLLVEEGGTSFEGWSLPELEVWVR